MCLRSPFQNQSKSSHIFTSSTRHLKRMCSTYLAFQIVAFSTFWYPYQLCYDVIMFCSVFWCTAAFHFYMFIVLPSFCPSTEWFGLVLQSEEIGFSVHQIADCIDLCFCSNKIFSRRDHKEKLTWMNPYSIHHVMVSSELLFIEFVKSYITLKRLTANYMMLLDFV